jgi:hypothetical protein
LLANLIWHSLRMPERMCSPASRLLQGLGCVS